MRPTAALLVVLASGCGESFGSGGSSADGGGSPGEAGAGGSAGVVPSSGGRGSDAGLGSGSSGAGGRAFGGSSPGAGGAVAAGGQGSGGSTATGGALAGGGDVGSGGVDGGGGTTSTGGLGSGGTVGSGGTEGTGGAVGSVVDGGLDGGGSADGSVDTDARGDAAVCELPPPQGAWPDSPTAYCSNGSLAAPCPGTGQPTFGQDGTRRGAIATYGVIGAVVSDSLLGLQWESGFSGPQMFGGAQSHCDSLVLDGKDDWRLPTRLELMSTVDYGRFDPVLDAAVFQAPTGTYRGFWTRAPHASAGPDHWVVNSQSGAVVSRGDILPAQGRCVRGPIQPAAFVDLGGCAIVFDALTGLGWQKWASAQTFGWADALSHCDDLTQDGASDWRLPSVKELQTIVDVSELDPAVDGNVFPGTPAERFWTSSPFVNDPSHAWAVDFWDGSALSDSPTSTPLRVRCVRGG